LAQSSSEKKPLFHFLILCFAEFNLEPGNNHLPNVVSCDDAADAKWLSFDAICVYECIYYYTWFDPKSRT
jgi:hypothetical protein